MEVYEVVAVIVSFVIGYIVTRAYYQKFKEKLHQIRECLDRVDEALADDTITKEEVQRIYEECSKILRR